MTLNIFLSTTTSPPAARARAEELSTLSAFSMCDTWQEVYGPAPDHNDPQRPKGWTWGLHTEQDECPHCRRIDKIHVSRHMSASIVRCYAKKMGSGDHRAVVTTLAPPNPTTVHPRQRILTSFLQCEDTTAGLTQRLRGLTAQGDEWWAQALRTIRTTAYTYERQLNPKGLSEVTAMHQASTVDYTPPEAANFRHQQRLTPATPRQPLVARAEQATQHKTDGIVLPKLRSALNAQPKKPQSKQQRRIEIARLTRELQSKRKQTALRNRAGHTFTEPTQIADELKQSWPGVMAKGEQSVEECAQFLQSLPLRPQLKGAATLLLKPLTQELVLTALEKMKPGSALGLDGVTTVILMALPGVLVPKMTEQIAQFLTTGKITDEWALANLRPIPNQKGSFSVTQPRPLCLQSVLFKWVSMTLYLMLQDLLLYAPPPPPSKKAS